jgi:hypothetical protein
LPCIDGDDKGHSDDDSDRVDGSLQRRRTAWNTTIGHRRVTQQEINERLVDNHIISRSVKYVGNIWDHPEYNQFVEIY